MKKAIPAVSLWWLWLGACAYIALFAYSLYKGGVTLDKYAPLDALDWLAACVPYFFIGALLGWCVDWTLAWHHNRKLTFPDWAWGTAWFMIISVAAAVLLATSKPLVVRLLFPIVYGVFFVVYAGEAILRGYADTLAGRAAIDIVVLGAFGSWLWLQTRTPESSVVLKRAIVFTLLLFITIGAVSCAAQLG